MDALHAYIVHTHAKDGLPLGAEVPLGAGAVDFPTYVTRLQSHGFQGFYTIEREHGDDPIGDVLKGLNYLRSL